MKKRGVAIFFILLANLIILAHGAIPHHHLPFQVVAENRSDISNHSHRHNHATTHSINHHHSDKDDYDRCLLNKVVSIQKDNTSNVTDFDHSVVSFQAILAEAIDCDFSSIAIDFEVTTSSFSYVSYAASVIGLRAPPFTV
jgi:hypothetical protein